MLASVRMTYFRTPSSGGGGGGAEVTYEATGGRVEGIGTSVTTTAPSGTNSGKILVLGLHSNATDTPDTPTGWTYIGRGTGWFGSVKVWLWWRLADGGANDTPSLTTSTSNPWETEIVRVAGADTTDPVDVAWNSSVPNSSDPITVGDVSVANDGSLAIIFGGQQSYSDFEMTSPASGYTLITADSGAQSGFFSAYAPLDAGAGGGGTWDWPGATRPAFNYVVLKPA